MKRTLAVIVLSQFFCTSLWFAGNAIMPELMKQLNLPVSYLAHITSAVQIGFICGTLLFAIFTIADRFSPSLVFCICASLAALLNLAISFENISAPSLLFFRFLTGFFLAGIYPVGMKIAADYYQKGLGKALGFLVGALVLGTAFPHFLKSVSTALLVKFVLFSTSALAFSGGIAMLLLVPNGPFRKRSQRINITAFFKVFQNKPFRAAAFGYFGHMWELYAFWVFVPVMLSSYNNRFPEANLNVSLMAFIIIAGGAFSCIISGLLSQKITPRKLAGTLLFLSGVCCLVSPFFLFIHSPEAFVLFLIFWGMVVVADSPLFSSLVAQNAPEQTRGTSLTIVNCVGFAITIVSIQLLNALLNNTNSQYLYVMLALGPVVGLIGLFSFSPTNQAKI